MIYMGWLKDLFSKGYEQDSEDDWVFSNLENPPEYKERWINIEITLMTPYSELIRLKSALNPYAEELGWKLKSGDRTEVTDNTKSGKIKKVNITLLPEEGSISPIEFLNTKEKIQGLVFSILRDIVYKGDHEEAYKNFDSTINITRVSLKGDKYNRSSYSIEESISFLSYSYKIIDRTNFEKTNKKEALALFGAPIEEVIKFIFENNKENEMAKEIKELFGFNI